MDREIKFRAWDKNTHKMYSEQEYGIALDGKLYAESDDWYYKFDDRKGWFKGENIILMQYTGLKDKHGKDIYEGDIVRCVALSNDCHQRGAITISPVEYFGSGFTLAITYVPLYPFCVDHDIEIIGTVFENPELLKEVK
jgi:uncharacterized phage protein (TIGR01671 family)